MNIKIVDAFPERRTKFQELRHKAIDIPANVVYKAGPFSNPAEAQKARQVVLTSIAQPRNFKWKTMVEAEPTNMLAGFYVYFKKER